ncbi:MAG: winged helix-turn-helix transcriptional regulator [Anaerolineaceae bacterium]|nr:winged helix-turn-helix transcriptional regulator [Anaerolineaceae bacterium]
MAITDKQFEEGLDVSRVKVIAFLEENSGSAYPYTEIAEATGLPKSFPTSLYYRAMLSTMVEAGLIEKKIIKARSYFRLAKKD